MKIEVKDNTIYINDQECNAELVAKLLNNSLEVAEGVLGEVGREAEAAAAKFSTFNSAHEAFGVIKEELDEFWDHVKVNQKIRNIDAMRKELVQLAAMAVRAVKDICDGGKGRV